MTSQQVHGALLEEAVLHLLRNSGYGTVDAPKGDPTLFLGGAGIFVRGRGGSHQIDAIADFLVPQPFSNPSRLLVEAKCYFRRSVRLPELRNAVGVLKDVSEYWVPSAAPTIVRKRYHYQAAIASATDFSKDAQEYAFAQDIYLMPLGKSAFFRPILNAIRTSVPARKIKAKAGRVGALRRLRIFVRAALRDHFMGEAPEPFPGDDQLELGPFVAACKNLDFLLLGVLGGQFPILFAPSSTMRHGDIPTNIKVRIYRDRRSWYLGHTRSKPLFSFDLPQRLFELYAEDGDLTPVELSNSNMIS